MATFPPSFDYNPNEISITEIERKALLMGFAKASEQHLSELRKIKRPSQSITAIIESLQKDLSEIEDEYGTK